MTHKDFALIARTLRAKVNTSLTRTVTMYEVVNAFADTLATTNENFDREKFIKAATGQ
jgi:hypothetical protein